MLVINGAKPDGEEVQYLHHGLALRPFARRFELADHVSVVGAKLENGLLVIDLKKEIPEEMKPRKIAIDAGQGAEAAPPVECGCGFRARPAPRMMMGAYRWMICRSSHLSA